MKNIDYTLVAVYPGIEDTDTTGMEYVGVIMDGGVYSRLDSKLDEVLKHCTL